MDCMLMLRRNYQKSFSQKIFIFLFSATVTVESFMQRSEAILKVNRSKSGHLLHLIMSFSALDSFYSNHLE